MQHEASQTVNNTRERQDKLIPREVLFADPDKIQVKLSPDGQYITYLATHEGVLNLWLAPLNQLGQAKPVTRSEHPLRDYWWTPSGDWLLYSHDHAGDENWQLYGYHLLTGENKTYTERGCQARLLQMTKANPRKILIALNERDKHYHDVYVLDIITGKKEDVLENSQYWDFIGDGEFRARIGIKINEHSGEYVDLISGESLMQIPQHDLFGLYFYPKLKPVFSHDNNTLYVVQSSVSNSSTLVAKNLKNKSSVDLANHPEADICDVLYHPQTKAPIAYAINHEHKQWFGLNEEISVLLGKLRQSHAGEIDIVSQNGGGSQWIVSFNHSDKPTEYYLYEHATHELRFLFLAQDNMQNYAFNPMQGIDIIMSDGTRCMSYLTLPSEMAVPVPLVMLVHGGPNFRDFWGFNAFHQWLSNRGYAVLSVNYRASTGFGRAHSESGNGEWAGKIREDIADAMDWAVAQGITTKDKVAIMGRSFGGYQVLAGLTYSPERYCCGIDIVGPANLETMMYCFPPYWKSMRGVLNDVVGADPDTIEGKEYLRKNSPLTYANQIKRPLLVGHGMNDPRIKQAESDQMVAAMEKNNVPVTYAVFSNEGHQLSHPENRMAFYGLVEAFLAKNLGGKAEPYSQAMPSTMELKRDDFGLIPSPAR